MSLIDELQRRWRLLRVHPMELWVVLHNNVHPEHISIHYNRLQLIAWGSFPIKSESRTLIQRAWNLYILLQINFFIVTTVWALHEDEDFVTLGQDLLWNCGMVYLMTKWHFLYFRADKVDDLVDRLEACHREVKKKTFSR
ncbi:odorant receptor 47b-like [Drosophila sulfurigaster albostrigata]|uniref:odorant receptor 47b-like n=1 Tax=Drosophila sulfurigaster albostrigata TaxID=89887 RepID=UPI002D21BEA2|nr:odorant receptor 47b-like [Drosophila sulfurigaster albostrigata]